MNLLSHIMNDDAAAMSDAELDFSLAYLSRWRPLFDGLPRGTRLLDAALCKFHRRDPLAVEFMRSQQVTA